MKSIPQTLMGLGLVVLSSVAHAQNSSLDVDPKKNDVTRKIQLEEVVVTGSHIRGSEAAGSKLIVIDREAIDASGYGRVQDVLATLTQNFKGIGEEALGTTGNRNRGAEVQLRGLGPGTTLMLVNGQRQALGGEYGAVMDISSIATSAIERIEILPEGASALYGSDAIGGVVNIILRKDFDGLETRVRGSTAGGDADETQMAQLWGASSSRGHTLVGYQYDHRDALPASARAYTAANHDFRRFGGDDLRTLGSNPGTIVVSGQTYTIPSGQDGTNLMQGQLVPGAVNYTDYVTLNSVLPKQEMHTALLSAGYDISDGWDVSVDGRYATRNFDFLYAQPAQILNVPVNNAFNGMGEPVTVSYQFTDDIGPLRNSGTTETVSTSAGVTGALPGQWQVNISGTYAWERNDYRFYNLLIDSAVQTYLNSSDRNVALNVFGDGSHTNPATLAALNNDNYLVQGSWTTTSGNVMADGPLFHMPAGAVRLAVGGDHRKEHLNHVSVDGIVTSANRNVSALFMELAVPVVAPFEAGFAHNELELSLAGRYEDYSDFGTTFDPKVGLNWRPWSFVKFRGTWGTSFRAPPFRLSTQTVSSFGRARTVSDPQASNGRSQVLQVGGADPNMKEETADVWTAGLDVTPAVENLSLSLTYFDIDYRGKIQGPGSVSTFLVQESQFAPLITRNPTQAQIDAVCSSPGFAGSCTGTFAAILDGRIRNLSSVKTRGLDADLAYSLATSRGHLGFGLNGTYTFEYETQLIAGSPVFDIVDTVGNPLALRLSGHLSWSLGGWTAQTKLNYVGSYRNPGAIPASKIGSWTTVDLNLGYQVETTNAWFSDTRFNFGVINLFSKEPPFVRSASIDEAFGYDSANATLLERQVSLQVIKAW